LKNKKVSRYSQMKTALKEVCKSMTSFTHLIKKSKGLFKKVSKLTQRTIRCRFRIKHELSQPINMIIFVSKRSRSI
jgi:hypothetical protein